MIAEQKYIKVSRAARLLQYVLFLEAVFVCNSLGYSNARKESDIDFFIIARSGRIWTCRFILVACAALFGVRPSSERKEDALCFSFFAASNALNLEAVKIGNEDPYLAHWIFQLMPVYDPRGYAQKICEENMWARRALPHAFPRESISRRSVRDTVLNRMFRAAAELCMQGRFGDMVERMLKRIQLRLFPTHLRSLMNTDTRVVVNDSMLKFHDRDRREEIAQEFQERLENVLRTV